MTDEYKTLRSEVRAETKVQGSRFIASGAPSKTRTLAEEFVARIKNQYFDATHNCFAYRIGTSADVYRFNDDGEPAGTAGKPILAAIDKVGVRDTVVVVTRYFGGTKLGVGRLIRAYGGAAENLLAPANLVTEFLLEIVDATFPHSHVGNVMHVVSKSGARIMDTTYDEEVHLRISIRKSLADDLKRLLIDQTNGNIRVSTADRLPGLAP